MSHTSSVETISVLTITSPTVTFVLAYAVDSYTANTSEMLIAMCIGKQMISFAFGLYLLDWVKTSGYVTIIAGIFCGVVFLNNLMVIPFMIWGKKIRTVWAGSWLARMHKQTITSKNEVL